MRRTFLPLAAAMLWATPASAQFWGGPGASGMPERFTDRPPSTLSSPPPAPGVGRDIRQVEDTIRDARNRGQLTRSEVRDLRRQSRYIGSLEARYRRDGLSASELAELRSRTEGLRGQVAAKRSN